MKEFDRLCREFEEMDAGTYTELLSQKAKDIIPALGEIMEDGIDGVMLFSAFIVGAVVADGELSAEEFALTFPLFGLFFGDEIDYADCNYLVGKMRRESKLLKRYVDDMVDAFGKLSEKLKDDIVLVCLMICAIDGKVSSAEKKWIKRLLK